MGVRMVKSTTEEMDCSSKILLQGKRCLDIGQAKRMVQNMNE